MPITVSQRPNRELLWLAVALVLVGSVFLPLGLWWAQIPQAEIGLGPKWKVERFQRLLLGPEQLACFTCFTWAGLVLFQRWREVWRQRRAFGLELLPTEEGARILPEDARPLSRKLNQITSRRGPLILANMVRLALGKYAVSRSATDVSEVVRAQAEVEQGRLVTSMGMVHYLCWAIPAVGFLGTVRGLADGLSHTKVTEAAIFLGRAFDCTFVALALSLVLMYLLHNVQRAEETLVIDCQQYCQEHLLLRLYDPQPEPEPVGME